MATFNEPEQVFVDSSNNVLGAVYVDGSDNLVLRHQSGLEITLTGSGLELGDIVDADDGTVYDVGDDLVNDPAVWTDTDSDGLLEPDTKSGVDVSEVKNDNYVEPQVTASEGTSYTADLSAANYHKVTLTGDVTIDFSGVDSAETNSVMLHLVQDSTGGRTPSFSPTVVWPGGSAPSWSTSANAEDVVTLVHDQDGAQWLGFVGGLGMA